MDCFWGGLRLFSSRQKAARSSRDCLYGSNGIGEASLLFNMVFSLPACDNSKDGRRQRVCGK